MITSQIKVLYIGGWQRSGSTILGNILNEADGFFHAGEICYLWTHKPWSKYLCGCGQTLSSCEVWQQVFEQAFGSMAAMEAYAGDRPASRKILFHLLGLSRSDNVVNHEYLEVLQRLYLAIHAVTAARVIVDSSKFPSHALLLQQIEGIDFRLLHLIRDPRGTAYSWQKKVKRADLNQGKQVEMPRFSAVNSSLKWLLWNIETELLGRRSSGKYLRLRYEDFATEPVKWASKILQFAGETGETSGFLEEREARLGVNHTVVGNPDRGNRGVVQLRPDDEWRSRMPRLERVKAAILSWPLMVRYGYF